MDIRQDQRYLAEKDLFPCGDRDESRFSPDFGVPLIGLGMEVIGDPSLPRDFLRPNPQRPQEKVRGVGKVILADLLEFIKVHDPDMVPFPYATPGF